MIESKTLNARQQDDAVLVVLRWIFFFFFLDTRDNSDDDDACDACMRTGPSFSGWKWIGDEGCGGCGGGENEKKIEAARRYRIRRAGRDFRARLSKQWVGGSAHYL